MSIDGPTRPQLQWHPPPSYHLKALKGWLNDPCAPGFNPATREYHLFYQWNPKSCDWGDICWGHFISPDGLHWDHDGTKPVLEPTKPYDDKGIFTGCMYPTGPRGEKGQLTIIYSSVNNLPIHWSVPYPRNSAGLALAISEDAGHTWHRSALNPILKGEPEHLKVTGFRDPYLAEWPVLSQILGEKEEMLYGIVSGGVADEGPNAFLYSVPPKNLSTWTYIGPLVNMPVGFRRPSHWDGDFGVNWECANFMTFGDGGHQYNILTMGTEGGQKRGARDQIHQSSAQSVTWMLWMSGSFRNINGQVVLAYDFGGILDHGTLYAPNSYQHPETGARILWGWIKEEELTLARRERKGWTGYLSLPRELFLLRLTNILRALKTRLDKIPAIRLLDSEVEDRKGGTIHTLGIRPSPNLTSLRPKTSLSWQSLMLKDDKPLLLATTKSTNWELESVIKISPSVQRVGFHLRHDEGLTNRTSVYFSVQDEMIVVDRTLSNNEADIQKEALSGPFTLFVSSLDCSEIIEDLHIRIFSDGDVLEVFANDRFALSCTVYTDTRTCLGISCFVEDDCTSTNRFESIELWEELHDVNGTRERSRI